MVKIELSAEEAEELSGILENDFSDLRMEIVDTESQEFRDRLKQRRDLLAKVIGLLKGSKA